MGKHPLEVSLAEYDAANELVVAQYFGEVSTADITRDERPDHLKTRKVKRLIDQRQRRKSYLLRAGRFEQARAEGFSV